MADATYSVQSMRYKLLEWSTHSLLWKSQWEILMTQACKFVKEDQFAYSRTMAKK